jgi:hypothetical protein
VKVIDHAEVPMAKQEIFISYSRADSEFVDRLESDLRRNGFSVWVDRSKLEGGREWLEMTQEALDNSTCVIVVASPGALDSPWVKTEYRYALANGKLVIPVNYHDARQIPKELASLQWVSMADGYDVSFARILRALSESSQTESLQSQAYLYVSYREEDAGEVFGRIIGNIDRLIIPDHVRSGYSVGQRGDLGSRLRRSIETAVRQSGVVIVIIGPRWLNLADIRGRRLLDDPGYPARIEIESALKYQVPIIPVLLSGTKLPRPGQLPKSLTPLLKHNALSLRLTDNAFPHDLYQLIHAIGQYLPIESSEIVDESEVAPPTAPSAPDRPAGRYRVFISHSHHDNAWCRALVPGMENENYEVFLDETSMQGTQSWLRTVANEIVNCDVFVLVLSPEAWASDWVQYEFELAFISHKPVLPLLLRAVDVTKLGFLRTIQLIDVQGLDGSRGAARAVDVVRNILMLREAQAS